eukprot:9644326-Alexandrium_andersonii.AAC.1
MPCSARACQFTSKTPGTRTCALRALEGAYSMMSPLGMFMLLRLRRCGFAAPRLPRTGARSSEEGLMPLGST